MKQLDRILENSLLAQLSLEERLYKEVERQLSQSNIDEYLDVKEMLSGVKEVLEQHYARLNIALDQVTKGGTDMVTTDGEDLVADDMGNSNGGKGRIRREAMSQMLQDDYAALNLAAMGNTLLHTTALAADSQEIADVTLEHLANLNHFVLKMCELVPKVVAQELSVRFPEVQQTLGTLAAKNTLETLRSTDEVP